MKTLRYAFLLLMPLLALQAFAQGSSSSSSYNFELYPFFGVNLPHAIKGIDSSLKGFGARAHYMINSPAALEVGSFFWSRDDDSGRTLDGGIYYEIQDTDLKPYFSAGVHYSKFKVAPKYRDDGSCTTRGCETATGTHVGLYAGGGIIFPISAVIPVKAGLRFYKTPSFWVLVDIGVGIRF